MNKPKPKICFKRNISKYYEIFELLSKLKINIRKQNYPLKFSLFFRSLILIDLILVVKIDIFNNLIFLQIKYIINIY